jgi:poly(3-hydroxybutyrate) depolymerase
MASASARPPVERSPGPGGDCVATHGAPNEELHRTVGRPACRAAEVLEWRDPTGAPRYACLYAPPDQKRGPLPVIVYFHGGGPGLDDPSSVSKLTKLRDQQRSFELGGEGRAGFYVLGIQGRAIFGARHGATFDVEHAADDNLDKLATDHFLDVVIERGSIDKSRVYTLGFGRGGQMAATYAMLRADRVAAFATYASAAPPARWQCPGPPPPGAILYRACDAVVPCESVEEWLRARDAAAASTKAYRLGEDVKEETNCAVRNKCSKKRGEANHHRWPKGREKDVLTFLSGHVLGPD